MSESRALYSSQEAVEMVGNRFDMVIIASMRVRELKRGHKTKLSAAVIQGKGPTDIALTEIEKGQVGREYLRRK